MSQTCLVSQQPHASSFRTSFWKNNSIAKTVIIGVLALVANVIFALIISVDALSQSLSPQALPPFLRDSLDSYVARGMKSWQIPAVAVCVVKDGKILVMKGYGTRSAGKQEPVDENTLFMIGSNTKAFTATALAMLEHEKRCALDDNVQKWLPAFTMHDPWVAKNATLTDLLCHRMGMKTFQGDFMYWNSSLSPQQVLEKFGKLPPAHDFRTTWGYCNAAFLAAGEAVSRIAGMPWEEFVSKKIFQPLQMTRSIALATPSTPLQNTAAAHTVVEGKLQQIPLYFVDNLAPAGSIFSSVNDLSHWLIAQLDSGRWNGTTVIPMAAIEQTRKPQSIIGNTQHPFNHMNFVLYGLGWDVSDYEGRRRVSHTGGVNGFVTSVTMIPSERLGIVVLTNTDQNSFYQTLKAEIVDAMLGLPYRNYDAHTSKRAAAFASESAAELAKQRDTIRMNKLPSIPLAAFAGRYEHSVYGAATIATNAASAGKLTMKFQHHPKLEGTLEHLSGNRFLCTFNDPLFGMSVASFRLSDDKKMTAAVSVKFPDFVEYDPYEFQRK
jgi:CubicO group peptidase (beta-lactamase class C family)